MSLVIQNLFSKFEFYRDTKVCTEDRNLLIEKIDASLS